MVDTAENRVVAWIHRKTKVFTMAFALTATSVASAAPIDGDWLTDGGGIWSVPTNWAGGTLPANADSIADFVGGWATSLAVDLDVDATIGRLAFRDGGSVNRDMTLSTSNGSVLTLDGDTVYATPIITARNRRLTINTVLAGDDGVLLLDPADSVGWIFINADNTYTGGTTIGDPAGAPSGSVSSRRLVTVLADGRLGFGDVLVQGSAGETTRDLELNHNMAIRSSSAVTVETDGDILLNYSGGSTLVQALTLGGVAKGPGTYDATTDAAFFTGAGTISTPADGAWGNIAGGTFNWTDSANWDDDHNADGIGDVAFGEDKIADFSDGNSNNFVSNTTVNLDNEVIIGGIVWRDSGTTNASVILQSSGGHALTLATSSGTPILNARNRDIRVEVVLAGDDGVQFLSDVDGEGRVLLRTASTYTGGTIIGDGPGTISSSKQHLVRVETGGQFGFGDVLVHGTNGDTDPELELDHNMAIRSTSGLTLDTGANVNLDYAAFQSTLVQSLTLGGVAKGPGTYNATTDAAFFSGTGHISTPADGGWAEDDSFIKRWTDASNWDDDFNGDGVGDVAFGEDKVADFANGNNYGQNVQVQIDGEVIIGEIKYRDSGGVNRDMFLLSSADDNALTMASSTGMPIIRVQNRGIFIDVEIAGEDGLEVIFEGGTNRGDNIGLRFETANTYTGGTVINTLDSLVVVEADSNLGLGDVLLRDSGTDSATDVDLRFEGNTALALTALLEIELGGLIDLDYANGVAGVIDETDMFIRRLILGGVDVGPGVFNASTHPTYFTGTGDIVVVPVPAALPAGLAMLGVVAARRRSRA